MFGFEKGGDRADIEGDNGGDEWQQSLRLSPVRASSAQVLLVAALGLSSHTLPQGCRRRRPVEGVLYVSGYPNPRGADAFGCVRFTKRTAVLSSANSALATTRELADSLPG